MLVSRVLPQNQSTTLQMEFEIILRCIAFVFLSDFDVSLVERRRRDKINTWINKLAKVVPECCQEQSKAGQVGGSQNIVSTF